MSVNILISFHSESKSEANLISDFLRSNKFDRIFEIDEKIPENVSVRADFIRYCDAIIVISSRNYQRNAFCMEVITYAQDLKKIIYPFNSDMSFRAFGALGLILAGSCLRLGDMKLVEIQDETNFKCFLNKLVTEHLNSIKVDEENAKRAGLLTSSRPITPFVDLSFDSTKDSVDVLVSFHPTNKETVELIEEAFKTNNISFLIEDSTTGKTNVKNCKSLVIIMSDEYEQNYKCKQIVNVARSLDKPIVPVCIKKGWKSDSWLGLIISGKLFFRIIDKTQVYYKKYDSTPMFDFINEVLKCITPKPSYSERNKSLVDSLKSRIEQCKKQLGDNWPPQHKIRPKKELKPVKIDFKEPQSNVNFNSYHTTVSRIGFYKPKSLFDNFGVPLRQKFDCMISYQWDSQDLVRALFEDLHMTNLVIWFDIWGYMEGCTYEAMATAIECSRVILVFLTDKYQKSVNCKLEFSYAVQRGKPFVFVIVEPNLKVESWIEPYLNESLKYEITKLEDEHILHNGVPRVIVIAQAIRDIGFAQIEDDSYEMSDEAVELKELLEDALDEIDKTRGQNRFKVCTRCNKQYDENTNVGCKLHTAYYLKSSLNLIPSKWVCCSQLDQYSFGCAETFHISNERVWTQDPHYGTFTWNPA